jgi:hypothetical protein
VRNRYPGTCYRCGKPVEKGAGHFERVPNSHPVLWRTLHVECVFDQRAEKQVARETQGGR